MRFVPGVSCPGSTIASAISLVPPSGWKVGLKGLHAPGDTDLARDMRGSLGVVAE